MVQKELTREEWEERLKAEQKVAGPEIVAANKDFVARAKHLGFAFDLDQSADILTITIGEGSDDTYTQGTNRFFIDLDIETNQVVRITILEFESAYLDTEDGQDLFSDDLLLPVLRKYGTMSFPPEREGTRIAAIELRLLVPA